LIYGFDEVKEAAKDYGLMYLVLKSGRIIDSTYHWNPIVFAYAFDHIEILKYFEPRARLYDMKRCMAVPEFVENDEEPRNNFRNFLRLLIENHCASIQMLLNSHYDMISYEDIIFIFSCIGTLKSDQKVLTMHDVMES
jgi:hypothetical protein